MTRFSPTERDRAMALRCIRYEFTHALMTPIHDEFGRPLPAEQFLVPWLVHCRNVIAFLQARDRKGDLDDVIPRDFDFPQRNLELPDGIERRLNKDLAHITYERTHRSSEDKQWSRQMIMPHILPACRAFAAHVLTAPPQGTSEEEIQAWRSLLADMAQLDAPQQG
jgi:hypothetical protein